MFKKLLSAKWLRVVFSVGLIYFAFRKVDIFHLVREIALVPWWFVVGMIVYLGVMSVVGGVRWSWLALGETKMKDYWYFTRATYLGGFYSLFFPTAVAGDMLKWLPLLEKYPELSKTKLAASVIIDRIVGMSAFVVTGFVALVVGKLLGYQFPPMLLLLFSGLLVGVIIFYVVVFNFDFEKYLGKYKVLSRLIQMMDILKKGNRKRIWNCFWLSMLAEPVWMLPYWFYSLIFGAGINLAEIYIFVPIIALILVLPISVAGFGARENLFLFFLAPLGYDPEKVLLVSTFAGLLGVINNLLGGLLVFINK